jgi:hypothetical protein
MVDLSKYAWVNEVDGVSYYRHIDNPKDEIQVKNGKKIKMKTKIKHHLGDVRIKNKNINRGFQGGM